MSTRIGDNPLLPPQDPERTVDSLSNPTGEGETQVPVRGHTSRVRAEGRGEARGEGRVRGEHTPGDRFSADPSRPTPMTETPTSPGSPLQGARGAGRPQGPRPGQAAPPPVTADRAVRVDRSVYTSTHRGDPIASRPIIERGEFYAPGSNQNWEDVVRQVYGSALGENASPETVRLLAEALAQLNGRSTLEAPPVTMAVPQLEDAKRYLRGMQRTLAMRRGEPIVRAAVTRYGGDNYRTATTPTAGRAYEARWNDTLRGVVLHAYRDQLVGLTPEEADHRLRCLMLAVASLNGLNASELQDAGTIWLPSPAQAREALAQLDNREAMQTLQAEHPRLWESIVRTGHGVVRDLTYLEGRTVPMGTPTVVLAQRIQTAGGVLSAAAIERAMATGPVGFNAFNIVNFNWLLTMFQEEPPPPGELPIKRPGEDLATYLDRVAPNLPPEQYRQVMENPALLMMISGGIINSNGDEDPARREQLMSALQRLGVVNEQGAWNITPREGETNEQALNRVTFEALRRMGLEVDESLGLEAAIAQASANARPDQRQLIHQLVIWNQLVLLSPAPGSEPGAPGGPGASGGSSGNLSGSLAAMLQASSYGFPPGQGDPSCYLCKVFKDLEPMEEIEALELESEEADDERSAFAASLDAVKRQKEAERRDSTGPLDEQDIAAARRFADTDEIIERDRRHAREVMERTADEGAEINRRQAEGAPVGGPGVRRGDGKN